MWFERMALEVWFDQYQFVIENDIGESAVKYLKVADLGIDLDDVALRYGHHTGTPELKDLIAQDYPGLTTENIVVTSGGSEAIFALNAATVKPADHVVVEHPNYPSIYDIPAGLGCEVTKFNLEFDEAFKPDFNRLRKLCTSATKMICVTHPNNPAGSMISEEELESLLQFCEEQDIYLLSDETYRELDFENALPPAASLSPKAISISTMSKCYGLPGIRVGWLATQDRTIIESVLAVREFTTITNNAVGEVIALHALRNKRQLLGAAKAHVEKNREMVAGWVANHSGVEWIPPEAGVVGLARLRQGLPIDPEVLYRRLAEQYRTFAIPGRCFGVDNRYFRLGFGSTYDEISCGLSNFDAALADLL